MSCFMSTITLLIKNLRSGLETKEWDISKTAVERGDLCVNIPMYTDLLKGTFSLLRPRALLCALHQKIATASLALSGIVHNYGTDHRPPP